MPRKSKTETDEPKPASPRATPSRKANAAKSASSPAPPTKEILVNAGDLETRVAVLEDGQLAELYIEREPRVVGNICQGKVVNVVRGMDAAFIDIGTERHAFLSADDVTLGGDDEEAPSRGNRPHVAITEVLKPGQEILVQVVRAAMGSKGPRVSTRLALPGRYLVLLMTDGAYVGVSRKIEKDAERQRLRAVAEEIRPGNYGLIVRTEAEGKDARALRKDLDYLLQVTKRIQEKARKVKAPALLHEDLPLISRVVRDTFGRQVKRVVVDSPEVYEDVMDLMDFVAPRFKSRVVLYKDKLPLFAAHGIDEEMDRLLRHRVWLRTGGYILVDETEALTTIDVNSGRLTATSGLEETILRTNLEAADEVARQLRLRDLGGIIVIDFIDMDKAKHRARVTEAFEANLRRDRAKTKTVHLSPLGLIEMTRKRTSGSLLRLLTDECPHCSGTGRMRAPLTVALGIERELARRAVQDFPDAVIIHAHHEVASILIGYGGERAAQLEKTVGRPVYVRSTGAQGSVEQFTAAPVDVRHVAEQIRLLKPGETIDAEVLVRAAAPGELTLAQVDGCLVGIQSEQPVEGDQVKVRVKDVRNSFATAEPLGAAETKRPSGRRRGSRGGRRHRAKSARPSDVTAPEAPAVETEVTAPPPSPPARRRRRSA